MGKNKEEFEVNFSVVKSVVSVILILLSLWCLWRSFLYVHMVNVVKFAVPGIILNVFAILVIKYFGFRRFILIPAYIFLVLLIGNLSIKIANEIHRKYYGDLYDAIKTGDARVVKRKILEGYDVNSKRQTKPILHFVFYWDATSSRYEPYPPRDIYEKKILQMLEVLIENDANVNAIDDFYGHTPLFLAVHYNLPKAVKFLLTKGADVNLPDKEGLTPLHLTLTPSIAKILINGGADVNAMDKKGNTPLHMSHFLDAVLILIDNGADINAVNKDGQTPLDIAIKNGYQDLVDFLREKGAKQSE